MERGECIKHEHCTQAISLSSHIHSEQDCKAAAGGIGKVVVSLQIKLQMSPVHCCKKIISINNVHDNIIFNVFFYISSKTTLSRDTSVLVLRVWTRTKHIKPYLCKTTGCSYGHKDMENELNRDRARYKLLKSVSDFRRCAQYKISGRAQQPAS